MDLIYRYSLSILSIDLIISYLFTYLSINQSIYLSTYRSIFLIYLLIYILYLIYIFQSVCLCIYHPLVNFNGRPGTWVPV